MCRVQMRILPDMREQAGLLQRSSVHLHQIECAMVTALDEQALQHAVRPQRLGRFSVGLGSATSVLIAKKCAFLPRWRRSSAPHRPKHSVVAYSAAACFGCTAYRYIAMSFTY